MHKPLLGRGRKGATLAEVLIAILSMSIGVLSLMSLFPMSILRSVRGHQLTQATILRYNAEAELDANPRLFADPDNDGDIVEHWATRFVVDPLGRTLVGTNTLGGLPRFSTFAEPPTYRVSQADQIATLPDSWIEQLDTTITSNSAAPGGLAFGAGDSLAGVPDPDSPAPGMGITSRVIFYDVTGKNSAVRRITNFPGPALAPTVNLDTPIAFTAGRVRVETQERRFTWILTCRGNTQASDYDVDVVVFFRRNFSGSAIGEDEHPYGPPANTHVFSMGSTLAKIDYSGLAEAPFIRKGGFIFDGAANGGYWYRIINFTDDTTSKILTITLDKAAKNTSDVALLMQGVVDVYALGPKSYRP